MSGRNCSGTIADGGHNISSDTTCTVLAIPDRPDTILVSWPDGRRTEQAIAQDGGEVTVKR
jgi:hypothetical protein